MNFNFSPDPKQENCVPKAKKITARELAKKQHDEKLVEFARQAKELCEKVKKGEKPTKALGKLLLKVKTYNPHGGLRKWIVKNIGPDVSTRNRCNYAMRLAKRPPEKERDKNRERAAGVSAKELKEIRSELSILMMSVLYGNVGEALKSREIIMNVVDNLVKKTEWFAFKRSRKKLLDTLAKSDDPQKKAVAEKQLAAEFNPMTFQAQALSYRRPTREKETTFELSQEREMDFTGRSSEDAAEKADAASAK